MSTPDAIRNILDWQHKHQGDVPYNEAAGTRLDFDWPHLTSATDCIAEGSMVQTKRGEVPIERVTTNDRVLTRRGYRRVLRAWRVRDDAEVVSVTIAGRTLRGTPDHRIWTENRGWIPLLSLNGSDTVVLCQTFQKLSASFVTESVRNTSSLRAEPTTATPTQSSHLTGTISKRPVATNRFTWPSGSPRTGQSRQAARFTTSITTPVTTISATSPAWNAPSIDKKAQQPGEHTFTSALSAEPSFSRSAISVLGEDSAPRNAKRRDSIESHGNGRNKLSKTNLPLNSSALSAARGITDLDTSTSHDSVVLNAEIGGTTPVASGTTAVYDLTVEGEHEFFAEGILVHNCSGMAIRMFKHFGGPDMQKALAHSTYTGNLTNVGTLVTKDRAKAAAGEGMLPGDTILFDWDGGNWDHIAIYAGDGRIWNHGGPGNGPANWSLSDNVWAARKVMVRRWMQPDTQPAKHRPSPTSGKRLHRPWPHYMRPGDYFGLASGPDHSRGGVNPEERGDVLAIKARLHTLGYTGMDLSSHYFGEGAKAAVAKWQREHHASTTTDYGVVYSDDWHHLFYF